MPTEQELKTFLAELQTKHPLKDRSPIVLLFAGWSIGSAHYKEQVIVLSKGWLKSEAISKYAVIHEYAHFYSQDNVTKSRKAIRGIHNFLAHDSKFKETETQFLSEYGIKIKRWLIYAREIKTPWGNPSPFDNTSVWQIILGAIKLNLWGLVTAILYLGLTGHHLSDGFSNYMITWFTAPLVVLWAIDDFVPSIVQDWVVFRYKRAKRGSI